MDTQPNRPTIHPSIQLADRLIVAALCLLAFALRLPPAFQNRFHADEALYASWAMRIASGRDVLLASVPVDKPPLAMYALAASLFAFGHAEIAARLPNLIASVVSVALMWSWARSLTPLPPLLTTILRLPLRQAQRPLRMPPSGEGGLLPAARHTPPLPKRSVSFRERGLGGEAIAALLMALSPFNIAFAGTAFLDPLMVMWGLAACVAATRDRAGWAGVFLGLAFATKVQCLLFAPLVVLTTAFAQDAEKNKTSALFASFAVRFAAGFILIVAVILGWTWLRGGTPFWVQQTINYGGIRPAFAREVGPRLIGWFNLLPHLFGPILGAALLAGVVALFIDALTRRRRTRLAALDLALITYTLGFLAFHWLFAFPVWDRYLLILVPVGAVLIARSFAVLSDWLASRRQIAIAPATRWIMLGVIGAAIVPFACQAARSELPIGGDHGPHDGLDHVAAYLRELPIGAVVYDHWLSWEFDYYLWDAPLYRAYFAAPADLARDLRVFGRTSTRYLVFPAGESPAKIARAIGAEDFALAPVLTTIDRFGQNSFTIYKIVPR